MGIGGDQVGSVEAPAQAGLGQMRVHRGVITHGDAQGPQAAGKADIEFVGGKTAIGKPYPSRGCGKGQAPIGIFHVHMLDIDMAIHARFTQVVLQRDAQLQGHITAPTQNQVIKKLAMILPHRAFLEHTQQGRTTALPTHIQAQYGLAEFGDAAHGPRHLGSDHLALDIHIHAGIDEAGRTLELVGLGPVRVELHACIVQFGHGLETALVVIKRPIQHIAAYQGRTMGDLAIQQGGIQPFDHRLGHHVDRPEALGHHQRRLADINAQVQDRPAFDREADATGQGDAVIVFDQTQIRHL